MQKSALFLSGVNAELQAVLSEVLPISIGSLPVKYLGVPLISTRLVYSDSLQLKEKKSSRVEGWSNELLSFGGKIQLTKSV